MTILKGSNAFSGFSVNDLAKAKEFYSGTLGLQIEDGPQGVILKVAGPNGVFMYAKENHEPATYTILNFRVDDIDAAVDDLAAKGITFEHYTGMTDTKGIARGLAAGQGPDIAWFKDPAGNYLSVLKDA